MRPRTRRQFLRLASLGATANFTRFGMMNALAAGAEDYKALVCIFMFGGNDGDNTVVPTAAGYTDYAGVRGGLALAQGALLPIGTTNNSPYGPDATYGLHPAMINLKAIADQATNRLAVAANVGTLVQPMTKAQYQAGIDPRPTRLFSHSDQVAEMQSGHPVHPSSSGWAGRVADLTASQNAPALFPTSVSLAGSALLLAGETTQQASLNPGSPLAPLGSTRSNAPARNQALQELLDFDTGLAVVQAAGQMLSDAIEIGQLIAAATELAPPLATVFPTSSLGNQLKQVAQLIQVRAALGMKRQIFFCSTGGFDNHSNQAPLHLNLLTNIDACMDAFYTATGELIVEDCVTTFTESDFARTFEPNATAGTDHGWGSPMFVLGGAVQGGLDGTFPTLDPAGPDSTDQRGRWIPTTSLDTFGATLARWFGVAEVDLPTVFPNLANFPSSNMGFMG